MRDVLSNNAFPLIISVAVAYVILRILAFLHNKYDMFPEEPDEIEVHPRLEGKELDQWLKLYEGISIQYQHSWLSAGSLAEIAWEQYGELTGKEIWETVPNPNKVANEAR